MTKTKNSTRLAIGTIVLSVSLFTAWAVGRDGSLPDGSPMDGVMAASASNELAGVKWDLPVTRNERVDTWINFLQNDNKEHTELWLERSGKYTPMIREQLRARGMPEDLIYLAFIESGYSTKARSHAAAVGLWQFIAETGRRYGLVVNSYIDERRDPIKSTDAALDYLNELYTRFGSWYLAAAAYNTGENRVARIMRQQTGSERGDDQDFWKIAGRLPRETRNYVPLMLAAGHIGKEPQKFGFASVAYHQPMSFTEVTVPGGVRLSTVAKAAGVSVESVEELNPQLLRGVTPPKKSWQVRVPEGTELRFAEAFVDVLRQDGLAPTNKATVLAKNTKATAKRYYSVRRGDNLSKIADRHNLSVKRLKSLNGLRSSTIRPGQRLRVT
ncbi:MAG TPA: transglycosylase SLT domain-containing protein [Longimicrobiales bacterium]